MSKAGMIHVDNFEPNERKCAPPKCQLPPEGADTLP